MRYDFAPPVEVVDRMLQRLTGCQIERRDEDAVYDVWSSAEPDHVPPPSVLAAARQHASDEVLVRLVVRLSWEGTLREYAVGDRFVELAAYFAKHAEIPVRGAA